MRPPAGCEDRAASCGRACVLALGEPRCPRTRGTDTVPSRSQLGRHLLRVSRLCGPDSGAGVTGGEGPGGPPLRSS